MSRRIVECATRAKQGDWPPWHPLLMCGPSLNSSTVGIVGLGEIGRAVARRLIGFGVQRILYVATTPKPDIEKVIGTCISLLNFMNLFTFSFDFDHTIK